MAMFIAAGALGSIPVGTRQSGGIRRAYLEVGSQRYDDCWVPDYLEASLAECIGKEIALSLCRLDRKGSLHLCAIQREDGRIERLPDQGASLLSPMVITAFIWGVITFFTTWLIAPLFLIPYWLLTKLGIQSEAIFGSVIFGGLFISWMAQLVWVLFYSKKLSPKVRLQLVTQATTAFDRTV
ncbi:hypothetical protein GJ699_33620 [Duganella sp. FT80W]|uniref:Uncharacterized protein n=1 Tax=Duganella guangzhouensis TaxID=2666084 RepID=A0A6I2LF84_9BURK|nr:hypothetical protein [Duganella guangzhouensis]MRW94899.1 hypothetical protein [Duganella guangzhouensis]